MNKTNIAYSPTTCKHMATLRGRKTMSNHVDKDKLLEDMNESHWEIVNAYANRIQSGMYDVEEPTVTLGDGTVARVGDKVTHAKTGSHFDLWCIGETPSEYRGSVQVVCRTLAGQLNVLSAANLKAYKEPDTWEKLEADCNDPDWLAEWSPEVNPLHLATDILDRAKKLARVK